MKPWRCRNCGQALGFPQEDGTLEIGGVRLVEAVVICPACRRRRRWVKREDQRFVDATDSEYWVAVCFQTREQKDESLQKARLADLGDKYLDGMAVARILGIRLDSRIPTMPQLRLDRRLSALVE